MEEDRRPCLITGAIIVSNSFLVRVVAIRGYSTVRMIVLFREYQESDGLILNSRRESAQAVVFERRWPASSESFPSGLPISPNISFDCETSKCLMSTGNLSCPVTVRVPGISEAL